MEKVIHAMENFFHTVEVPDFREGDGQARKQTEKCRNARTDPFGKEGNPTQASDGTGAPGRTRTCDRRIRNPMLYPTELQAQPKKNGLFQFLGL
jgi:hypothetical protein